MSLRSLESAITREAREVLNNRTLRVKDMQEWSTTRIRPCDDEFVIHLPLNNVYVAYRPAADKRKK